MYSGKEFLQDLWCDLANQPSKSPLNKPLKKIPSLEVLYKTQWSPEFEKGMRDRLVMGAFRYDLIEKQDFSQYDLISESVKRALKYKKDHNLEHLMDAANMLLLAFIHGKRLGHIIKSIDDGEHSQKIL